MGEYRYYPLNASQEVLFLSRKYTIHKSIINIPTSLLVHEKLNLDILETAVNESIQRWDSLGIRLTKKDGDIIQYFADREVEYVKRLDFTTTSRVEMEHTFKRLASKKLPIFDKPMARIYLVTSPEGYGGIFTVISHLIMDSWAISAFYRDIMNIYYHKLGQGEYPKEIFPYEKVLQKEFEYQKSPAYEKAKMFWESEFSKDEPIYTHVNGSGVLEQYRKKRGKENSRASNGFFIKSTAANDFYWVNKEDVEKFNDFIKDFKLPSMQTLFQVALHTFLSKMNNGEEDISTYHNIARRSTIEEKKTGGTRAQTLCYRNILDKNTTFLDACHQLLSKQNEIYRHADLNSLEMLKMQKSILNIKENEGYYSVSMSFQLIPMKIKDNLEIETKWYSNGAVAIMLYINIMDGDGTGGLKCYYEYMSNHINADKIKELHESMVKIILMGCHNPKITLAEFFEVF